jgi:hypothetical protein
MNGDWGDVPNILRDTKIIEGCLGSFQSVLTMFKAWFSLKVMLDHIAFEKGYVPNWILLLAQSKKRKRKLSF